MKIKSGLTPELISRYVDLCRQIGWKAAQEAMKQTMKFRKKNK